MSRAPERWAVTGDGDDLSVNGQLAALGIRIQPSEVALGLLVRRGRLPT